MSSTVNKRFTKLLVLLIGIAIWSLAVPNKNLLRQTGGRQISSAEGWLKAEKEAEDFYHRVRTLGSNADVRAIAEHTGMPEFRVQRIKEHIFINKHHLSDGSFSRFHPDFEISDAWQRLEAGRFYKQDIDLLRHEIFESKVEGIFKTDYRTAHDFTVNRGGRDWDPSVLTELTRSWRP